ncbi:MAG: hypothetical protein AB7S26_34035 [Sandaracinaceae bacterium]
MRRGLWWLVSLSLLSACDGGVPPPPRQDAARRDGGAGVDAGRLDASLDASGADAGAPADAGLLRCTFDPSDAMLLGSDPRLTPRTVALAAGATRFAVAWNGQPEGQPDVYARTFGTSGFSDEVALTDTPSRENRPSLLAVGADWLAAWSDNEGGSGYEIRASHLDGALVEVGSRQSLTSAPAVLEDVPVLAGTAAGPMLAWVDDDMVARTRQARALRLNTDGTANGGVQMVGTAGRSVGGLSLGELAAGPVVVWAEQGVGGQEVWLQPLTSDGANRGSPVALTASANSDGSIDVALGIDGGAVVFGVAVGGVRREVRFHAIAANGDLVGAERILTPDGGTDASIAAFAGGYAVTYRSPASPTSQIVLLLVSALGAVLDEIPIQDASAGGGRTTVRVTGEGQIGISWADEAGGAIESHAALVRCGP